MSSRAVRRGRAKYICVASLSILAVVQGITKLYGATPLLEELSLRRRVGHQTRVSVGVVVSLLVCRISSLLRGLHATKGVGTISFVTSSTLAATGDMKCES